MPVLPEIRLGTRLINSVAVGDKLMGWNDINDIIPTKVEEFVAATGITNQSTISALTSLYNGLNDNGLFDRFYAIYPFVGSTSTTQAYNLVDTGSYEINFNGGGVHSDNGYSVVGNLGFADTTFLGFNSGSGTDGWIDNSSLGVYSRTSGSGGYDMGSQTGTGGPDFQTGLIVKYNANDDFYPGLPVGLQYTGSIDGRGFYTANRSGSLVSGFIDGTKVISGSNPTYETSNRSIYIGGFNPLTAPDTYGSREYAFAFLAESFTDSEQATLSTIVENFQNDLNRSNDVDLPTTTRILYLDADDVNSYNGSGANWYDLENNTNVTLRGTYSYGSTPAGNIDFAGLGATPGDGLFASEINLDEFTISSWFRIDTLSTVQTFVGTSGTTAQPAQPKIVMLGDGDVQFRAIVAEDAVRMDIGYDTGSMVGDWHMLTVKRDSSSNVYAKLDDDTWVTGSQTITGSFDISLIADNRNTNQNLDGAISNMLMYSSSLSDSDVSNIYNHFLPEF